MTKFSERERRSFTNNIEAMIAACAYMGDLYMCLSNKSLIHTEDICNEVLSLANIGNSFPADNRV
jgi:hypothetical protein